MIDKRVYELDYIRELKKKYVSDPGLIERALQNTEIVKVRYHG